MKDQITDRVRTTLCCCVIIVSVTIMMSVTPAGAAQEDLEHIRGQVTSVESSSPVSAAVIKTANGKTVRVRFPATATILVLTKSSFTEVDFGKYVGSVAIKLDEYSPIIRDSAVWLHKGFELRIIDEDLRGIALGEKKWDMPPGSIMSHGWVDDLEIRVISIKWGPSDYDETDVEIPRDAPVFRMSRGDSNAISKGANVFVGAKKGADGNYAANFIIIGKDGISPKL